MFTKIFRIWGILLMISAMTFWWISLGQKNETKFWNIGAYSIVSVSARDDEWEEDKDENDSWDSRRRRKEDEGEWDDDREQYIIQENTPVDPIPIESSPVIVIEKVTTPIRVNPETCVTTVGSTPISLEEKILQTLGWLGLDAEQRQILQSQFQGLYGDISQKYPTSSWIIDVLQQLSRQAESKINELRSLPKVDSSTIFTTKIQSLQALKALANIQIEVLNPPLPIETSIPCASSATSPTVTAPAPVTVKKVPAPTPVKVTPVVSKPVTPTPVKITPTPVKVAPKPVAPVVNTRTTAS